MRSLGSSFHEKGAWVVGLRVPGHGTAPVGLTDVTWQDMAAAVKLAMQHLRNQLDGGPLYLVGYSNGGALAVQYALTSLEDESLPSVQGLVLLAPEIGVTKLGTLAVWQERMGHMLGMEKLAWNSIMPEYDTYKYVSFALNAGKQAHLITNEIQQHLTRLSETDALQRMPPILTFQSVVDATVVVSELVEGLYERLPKGLHELILFDVNRSAINEPILTSTPAWMDTLLHDRELDYTLTLITNENRDSTKVLARSRKPGSKTTIECPLGSRWPNDVYSLSHVALTFPADDPLYGNGESRNTVGLQLGHLSPRGERGVLNIPIADMMRLHWNPFYTYQERRILNFLGLVRTKATDCRD